MPTAGQICNRTVVYVRTDESLVTATERMRAHGVDDVLVCEETDAGRVPVGILSGGEIDTEVSPHGAELLGSVHAGDVLFHQLVLVSESERLTDVLRTMFAHGVRRVPVVGAAGTVVGLLTIDDVMRYVSRAIPRASTRSPARPGRTLH